MLTQWNTHMGEIAASNSSETWPNRIIKQSARTARTVTSAFQDKIHTEIVLTLIQMNDTKWIYRKPHQDI